MQFTRTLLSRSFSGGTKRIFPVKKTTPTGSQSTPKPHDISKMPQPHPVITPINRNNQVISDTFTSYKIEIDSELQKRLPKSLSEVSNHFGGNFFILRSSIFDEITSTMKTNDKIVLDGPNGSGKSVALMQVFASFKESIRLDEKKLSLFVPNVHKWTRGYFSYYPNGSNYIQPELSLEILGLLAVCNKGKKFTEGLEIEIKEAQFDAYNRAIPLYEKVFKEISENGYELTMFLDGINGILDENSLTSYLDVEGNKLPLKSLPLCSQIYRMPGIKVIGSMTHSNSALPSNIQIPSNIQVINVNNYNPDEFKRVLQLYTQLGHSSGPKSDQFVAFKSFVSGSNGRKLFKSCEYDSIYYKPIQINK